jgi:hypothetical protein
MAAATVWATGANSQPVCIPHGSILLPLNPITIESTSVTTAGDRANLFAIPNGARVEFLIDFAHGDGDTGGTPTLDMDLVYVTDFEDWDDNGTETIFYNAGTAFTGAITTANRLDPIYIGHKFANSYAGFGLIRAKVNTEAVTPADVSLEGYLIVTAP